MVKTNHIIFAIKKTFLNYKVPFWSIASPAYKTHSRCWTNTHLFHTSERKATMTRRYDIVWDDSSSISSKRLVLSFTRTGHAQRLIVWKRYTETMRELKSRVSSSWRTEKTNGKPFQQWRFQRKLQLQQPSICNPRLWEQSAIVFQYF